jgi:hypothetical protein
LFISVDSVDNQANYIRTGLDFQKMKTNVNRFLDETANTTVTFINTFNVLSVPKIKDYLQYILDLRLQYSKEKQGVKHIPIYDPNYTHPDYEIYPRQRIWFDLPILRYPDWQSITILPKEFDDYIIDAIAFMKENNNTDNFVGFYDFEIAKLERNLQIMQDRVAVSKEQLQVNRKNFYTFFQQYDKRNSLSFTETFPELAEFYISCKNV